MENVKHAYTVIVYVFGASYLETDLHSLAG